MHNMKNLILSVFIFTFGFATSTHAKQMNTLLQNSAGSTGSTDSHFRSLASDASIAFPP